MKYTSNSKKIEAREDDSFFTGEKEILVINGFYHQKTALGLFPFVAETLEEFKDLKLYEIDKKTQGLIFKGFQYANLTWSLSITAQINWSNLLQLPDALFPLPIQAKDLTVYNLPLDERMNFYLTALNSKNLPLQSGHALKLQVQAMTTIDEINNFTDNRN